MPTSQQDQTPLPQEQRTIAEISELAGGLAHELRNPLSTIMIHLKLLTEDLRDPRAHPEDVRRRALLKIELLQREAGRLQSLFDEFLTLTSPNQLERKRTDVNELIGRLLEFYEPLAHDRSVTVELGLDPGPCMCSVDEKLLRRALLNIVINAQEAMPDGGILRIATERKEDEVAVTISDTGVGIDEAHQEEILRPFFSTKGTGTGLGLSIAQRIIIEHGGTLSFESRSPEGTTFTIHLPRDTENAEREVPRS